MDRIALRQFIIEKFNMDSLNLLCILCETDLEHLDGSTKPAKVLELVQFMQGRSLLGTLERIAVAMTDKLDLPEELPIARFVNFVRNRVNSKDLAMISTVTGVSIEEITGDNVIRQSTELWQYWQRRGDLHGLMEALTTVRPDVPWMSVFELEKA